MRVSNRLLLAASVASLAVLVGQTDAALASGFALREMTADQTAHAFSGGVSEASDPSTAYSNPAGMSQIQGIQLQLNSNLVLPSATFSGSNTITGLGTTTGTTGNVVQTAVTGGIALVAPINERVNFGVALMTPYGQRVSNPANWVGHYQSLVSSITDISLSLAASYKINDQFSIGGGPVIDEFEARLTQAVNTYSQLANVNPALTPYSTIGNTVADMHGSDAGIGFNIGGMYKLDAQTNIGVDYRSQIKHSVTGNQTVTPSAAIAGIPTYGTLIAANIASLSSAAATSVTLPDSVNIGITRQVTPDLKLMAEAQWTDWSVLKTIVVTTNSPTTSSTLNENWRNTFYVGAGADYRLNEKLTLKGGLGFDQSPVTFSNRTTRIPDGDRIIVGLGASYEVSKSMRAEVGYAHLFVGSQSINNAADLLKGTGTIVGKYSDTVDVLSLSLTIKL